MLPYAALNLDDFQSEISTRNISCLGTKTSPNAVNVIASKLPRFEKVLDTLVDFGTNGILSNSQKNA